MIAITDHFDSDHGDEANGMIVPIKNIVNSMYAKVISKKVFAAHQSAMERGTLILTKSPYRHILNRKNRGLYSKSSCSLLRKTDFLLETSGNFSR